MLLRYVARRVVEALGVVFGVITIVFFTERLTGDPTALFVPDGATKADVAAIRESLGFADPVWLQYVHFLGNTVTGHFGTSIRYREPVLTVVAQAAPVTAELVVAALSMAALGGILAGVLAAVRKDSWLDTLLMGISVLGQAMPVFWLGVLLVYLFAVRLRLLPSGGWGSPEQLILPAVTLGAYSMARISRIVRSGMLDVLGQDYIRTARSKGLGRSYIILRHALRNAIIPLVTLTGMELGVLLGGTVIAEEIFSIPGLGSISVNSILQHDYAVTQATVFYISVVITAVNILVDLSYLRLDPRIRLA